MAEGGPHSIDAIRAAFALTYLEAVGPSIEDILQAARIIEGNP